VEVKGLHLGADTSNLRASLKWVWWESGFLPGPCIFRVETMEAAGEAPVQDNHFLRQKWEAQLLGISPDPIKFPRRAPMITLHSESVQKHLQMQTFSRLFRMVGYRATDERRTIYDNGNILLSCLIWKMPNLYSISLWLIRIRISQHGAEFSFVLCPSWRNPLALWKPEVKREGALILPTHHMDPLARNWVLSIFIL
jgi:hypothetical protein